MYRVNSGYVTLLVNMLWAEELDVPGLCQEAGLDMALLQHSEAYFERRIIYRLLEMAADWSDNPNIGLKAYEHFHPGSFKLVGYAMMSSANLKQALDRMVRFNPLIGNGFNLSLTEEAEHYRLSGIELHENGSACPRQYLDAGIASLHGFCRWLTGEHLPYPISIDFPYPEPRDTHLHQRIFGCPMYFGAAQASVLFDKHSLMHPLLTSNEALSALHDSFAEAQLGLLGHTLTARVRALIVGGLQQRKFDIDSIANALCISKRTLQRELEKEGTQFKDILDGVRKKMASFYLRHAHYRLKQTAYLLGFQDLSSFHKACLRWFGMPPGQYRSMIEVSRENFRQAKEESSTTVE